MKSPRAPLDREAIVKVALQLLNRDGFEGLTLRKLATELGVQAPAIYWHFANKQELLDEMATQVFRDSFDQLGLPPRDLPWQDWCRQFAAAERQMLLHYRDGARIFSGTYLTDPSMFIPMEASLQKLTSDGLPLATALQVLTTIHCYVVGFTIEEQAVWPTPDRRDSRYAPEQRSARLDPDQFPLTIQAGTHIFESPASRFELGVAMILRGVEVQEANHPATSPVTPGKP